MGAFDIIIIVGVILVGIVVGLYYLNRWAAKKQAAQQKFVDSSKMETTIFVLDKKHDKAKNVNLPKVVMTKLPKMYRVMKMYFVQAKVGPQIVTLMCDKNVFRAIPVKKNVKIELAGMYITSIKGMKTEYEKKQLAKQKQKQDKREKDLAKFMAKEAKRK